ncbi:MULTISPECIES: fimbrial protein [Providencia]|uniref:Fimbrial protein n=1 Tax=Providencia rettgeri TaxID=587 RepID=A0AAJ6FW36_PRORE|nr:MULTISPECIES: fimbrial protein [Providencia]ELR5166289.1 type 1 fimbrial protein [Providencia rettgeri]ELR5245708.1 type 1 fimbrial protein [Providencia rettgeri]WHT81747.1 fimbrial protein [Providencia rettgeri]WHT95918.1 fimbrial protein [Providencia rettgeri]WJM88283.1 fimbrial protein [Providencia rettgeri]
MKKVILATLVCSAMSASVFAADMGHGKVTFKGAIITAPCSISPVSIDQTVELGQIADSTLAGSGKSTPSTFNVLLQNCKTDTLKSVQLTFSGAAAAFDTSNKTLGIVGTASGAGVQITNGAGEVITLGKASPLQLIQDGNNTLSFSAYLIGDGDKAAVGEFSSVTDFTLNYE